MDFHSLCSASRHTNTTRISKPKRSCAQEDICFKIGFLTCGASKDHCWCHTYYLVGKVQIIAIGKNFGVYIKLREGACGSKMVLITNG